MTLGSRSGHRMACLCVAPTFVKGCEEEGKGEEKEVEEEEGQEEEEYATKPACDPQSLKYLLFDLLHKTFTTPWSVVSHLLCAPHCQVKCQPKIMPSALPRHHVF